MEVFKKIDKYYKLLGGETIFMVKIYPMKIIKGLLFFILGLIALGLIIALFVDKEFGCTREVTINRPKQEVFNYIKYLKNQDNFSVWAKMDPNMKKDFKGTDGEIGATQFWDGNDKVGKGEQEIKKIVEGESVDFELRFLKPWESTSQAYMTTKSETDSSTKVQWGMHGKSPYPMNLMNLFMDMDKMVGPDLQTGLDNLKALLESMPPAAVAAPTPAP